MQNQRWCPNDPRKKGIDSGDDNDDDDDDDVREKMLLMPELLQSKSGIREFYSPYDNPIPPPSAPNTLELLPCEFHPCEMCGLILAWTGCIFVKHR